MFFKPFLLSCTALLATTVPSSGQYTLKMPHERVIVENDHGTAVFKNMVTYGKPGQPDMPVYSVTFLVPPETDPRDVSVTVENPVDSVLPGKWNVLHALPPSTNESTPVSECPKDMSVYGQSTFFPESWTGNVTFGKLRENLLVKITVNPCKYNPVTGEIRMLVGGELTLSIENHSSVKSIVPALTCDSMTRMQLKDLIVNPKVLDKSATDAQTSAAAPAATVSYAIITTNAIIDALTHSPPNWLNVYINYLQTAGYDVMLATEDTWGGGTGDAAAENIRAWLKGNYSKYSIHFALLIGNPDPVNGDVPMKNIFPYYDTNGEFPSDFYYAELSGNWDVDNDGRFGEYANDFNVTGGADQYAEVVVGRIPYYPTNPNPVTDLQNILKKSWVYANAANKEWRKSIMLPMSPWHTDTPNYQIGEEIKDVICTPFQISNYRLYSEKFVRGLDDTVFPGVVNMYPPMDAILDVDNVRYAWTHNYFGVVTWTAHGGQDGAADVISSGNVNVLDDTHPSMVASPSCENAHPENSNNLAYALLCNGAITSVANTRNGLFWYRENYISGSASGTGLVYSYTAGVLGLSNCSGYALNRAKNVGSITDANFWRSAVEMVHYGCPDLSLDFPYDMPVAPTNLKVSTSSQFVFNLTWKDNATNETGYCIEQADNANGPFTQIYLLSPNTTSTTVLAGYGEKKLFRVRAVNDSVYSVYSNMDSSTTYDSSNARMVPAVPANLSFFNVKEDGVSLQWQAAAGATSYIIKRSTVSGGPYLTVASGITNTFDTISDLIPGTNYFFVVSAVNSYGHSANSAQLIAQCVATVPNEPTNFRAVPSDTNSTEINLFWNDNSYTEIAYYFEIATSPSGPWSSCGSANQNMTSQTIRSLNENTAYYFRMRAYNYVGASSYSNVTNATVTNVKLGRFEAENAQLSGTAGVNTNHPGYSGTGFVDGYRNSTTARTTFNVTIPSITVSGSYKVVLRYSAGNGKSTNTGLFVNGVNIKNITCESTGDWNTWNNELETITLNPGNNTIAYQATSSSNDCINLDYIDIIGPATFSISASAGANGSISPSGIISVTAHANRSFTITPNSGYTVNAVFLDGSNLGVRTSYTFTDVIANHSISALFTSSDPCSGVYGGVNGLSGLTFGTNPPWSAGSEYCKATDGNISTYYDYSQADGGYTGMDLGSAKVIGKIRYYPRSSLASRMTGGKFQGSNTSSSSGFVDLYTISTTPAAQWNEIIISNPTTYRWVRYLSPDGGYGNIAEMEFYEAQAQTPYNGPHNITNGATLQAEDFDNGGEGVAYHDNDATNNGGAYRTNEGVDIENGTAGVTNVGWTATGEWLEYTCNVTAGTYNITLYVSSPNTGTQLRLYQDNTLKATFSIPNTGAWQSYQQVTVNNVALSAGSASVLRIEETGGFNFDKISFVSTGSAIIMEAENAALSGDANVNTNHTGYLGTGFVDGYYNSTSAQTSFSMNITTAGNYRVALRYSAGNGTSTNVGLYVNSVKIKNITCLATADWNTWSEISETVSLNQHMNTIMFKAETSSSSCINVDRITITQ